MKTLRLFGISLLTVLMSVSFSACGGSDEEDDNGGGGNTPSVSKRLVKRTEQLSSITYSYEFSYDSQGRIIKKERNSGTKTRYYVYTYTDNLIVEKGYYNNNLNNITESSYTLENGLIVLGKNEKYSRCQYIYENGRLTTAKEGNNVYSYIWENDNIIRIDCNGEISEKFEYTNYTAPQGIFTLSHTQEDLGLFYGKSSQNLPSKCTSYGENGEEWESTLDWTLKDGLPVKLNIMSKYRDVSGTYSYGTAIYTYEWE